MKKFSKLAAVVALGVSTVAVAATVYVTSSLVGTIEGKFAVTPSGAATYVFSVEVPPGTNGVQPELPVIYNSQGTNGMMGEGFSLGGISSISRCGYIQNYKQSNFLRVGVNFNSNDHFCLDGEALVVTNGGVYGAEGTEYRPAEENWTKVISHNDGTCGGGPCYFTAYNKDGSKIEFGNTTDSKVLGSSSTNLVRTWTMNSYTDLNSNYTQVQYSNNSVSGEYYVNKILYTGNTKTGKTPQRSVQFSYEVRSDKIQGYLVGANVQTNNRLKTIATYVGSKKVLQYNLGYIYSQATGSSLLSSIQKCDTSGICMPQTTLTWQSQFTSGFSSGSQSVTDTASSNIGLLVSDITGDGNADMVRTWNNNGKFSITSFISNGNGTFQTTGINSSSNNGDTVLAVYGDDMNGDNKEDVIELGRDASSNLVIIYYPSNGTGSFATSNRTSTGKNATAIGFGPGDVNGDGRADVVQAWNDGGQLSLTAYLSNGGTAINYGTGIITKTGISLSTYPALSIMVADANGDGNADVLQTWNNQGRLGIKVYLSNGSGGFTNADGVGIGNASSISTTSLSTVDINGDGKADVVQNWVSGQDLKISAIISRGNGAYNAAITTTITGGSKSSQTLLMGDVNGDSYADLVQVWSNSGKANTNIFLSNGNGTFQTAALAATSTYDFTNLGISLGDINGDGKMDAVLPYNASGSKLGLIGYTSTGATPDLLTNIVNGIGGKISISYSKLTNSAIYTASTSNVSYPVQKIQTPMNIVQQYVACDGTSNSSGVSYCDGTTASGHQYIYNYTYSGALYDAQLSQWLGFATFKSFDNANQKYSIATYRQDYPYNGNVSTTEVCQMAPGTTGSKLCSDNSGSLMSKNTITYTDLSRTYNQPADINQIVPTVQTMEIYTLGQSTASVKVGKKYDYDKYGNITIASDLGNVDNNNNSLSNVDNYALYNCALYYNDETNWILGYAIQQKQEKSYSGCQSFVALNSTPAAVTWNSSTDLSWSKTGYDYPTTGGGTMNVLSGSAYDSTSATDLVSYATYDSYGNVIGIIAASGRANTSSDVNCTDNETQTCITYDTTYSTFVTQVQSPKNAAGVRLTSWQSYEPNFGQQVSSTNVNATSAGQTAYTIYREYDGFGRGVNAYGPNQSGSKTLLSTNQYIAGGANGALVGMYKKSFNMQNWSSSDQTTWNWTENYLDGMNRNYLNRSRGTNGSTDDAIVEATNFSAQGQVDGQTAPYYQSTNTTNALPTTWDMNCGTGTSTGSTASNTLGWNKTSYNIYNQPTCSTVSDAVQQKIAYSYVASGNINLLNTTKTQAYNTSDAVNGSVYVNAQQLPVRKYYPNGDVVYYKYDQLGRLIATSLSAYSGSTCSTLAKGTVCFTYDSLGRVLTQKSSDTGTQTTTYDENRVASYTNGDGNTIQYTYDNLDRVLTKVSTSYVNGVASSVQTNSFTYDAYSGTQNSKGNLAYLEGRDKDGSLIYSYVMSYNNYGLISAVSKNIPSLSTTPLTYSMTYDPAGRPLTYTYPDGSIKMVNYRTDGNVGSIQMCDSGTGVVCSTSSTSNFKTYSSYYNYTPQGPAGNIDYSNNQGTTIINFVNAYYPSQGVSSGTTFTGPAYTLNSINATLPLSGNFKIFKGVYSYNRLGYVTAVDSSMGAQSFTYNGQASNSGMGFLTAATGDYGSYQYSYDDVGNISSKTTDSAVSYQYKNNSSNQLVSGSNGLVQTYTTGGNLLQKTKDGATWNYQYNPEGRVSNFVKSQSGSSDITQTNVYDGVGNQLWAQASSGGNTKTTYMLAPDYEIDNYGSGNIVNTKYVTGPDGVVAAVSYNGSGIPGAVILAYNNHKMMAQFLGYQDGVVEQSKALYHSLAAAFTALAIDSQIVENLIMLVAGIGLALLLSTSFARYKEGSPARIFVTPFLTAIFFFCSASTSYAAMSAGANGAGNPVAGNTRFFIKNNLGNVVEVTDQNGTKTANVEYTPYGTLDQNQTTGYDDFRPKFGQNPWNSNNLTYAFNNRYYDPELGRFTAPDPAAQYSSPYVYAGSNPTSYIDPDGDFAVYVAVIVVGALAGAYMGGVAVNDGQMDPSQWDWQDGTTYEGIFGGAVIGGVGAAAAMSAAGFGFAAGLAGAMMVGAGENAAFTAMGGGSPKEIAIAAAEGAALGLAIDLGFGALGMAFEAGSEALGGLLSKLARETEEIGDGVGGELSNTGDEGLEYCSFVAGTKVKTESGVKNIEQVTDKEKVFGYDFAQKKSGFYQVLQTHNREAFSLVTITTKNNEIIKVTPEHPFWIEAKQQWVTAANLQTGDLLTDETKKTVAIKSIDTAALTNPVRVYNFTVDKTENYYVSNDHVLSHNCPGKAGKSSDGTRKSNRVSTAPDRLTYEGSAKYNPSEGRPGFNSNIRKTISERDGNICQICGDYVSPDDTIPSSNTGRPIPKGQVDHYESWKSLKTRYRFKRVYSRASGKWRWSKEAIAEYNNLDNLRWTCIFCNAGKGG